MPVGPSTHDEHPHPGRPHPRRSHRPRRAVRGVHRLGDRPGARAVPPPGRGAARAGHRRARDPVDADRLREVARRGRRALRRAGPGPTDVLHRPAQGAGQREVLRARRGVRVRQRRDDDGRLGGQPGRPDHLLHGGDPGQRGPARRRRRRRRPGRHGRVPLLRRPAARLGVAGAAAGADEGPVRAHVRDARRRRLLRGGPDPADPPARRGHRQRRAARAADVLLRDRAAARAPRRAGEDPSRPRLRRALHAEGGRRAGAVAHVDAPGQPRAAGPDRRRDRGVPLRSGLRPHPQPAAAARGRRAPRGDAAQVPPGGRAPHAAGSAAGGLRHGHARRRHQRPHPHGAADQPGQVRRRPHAAPVRARVPPDLRARRAGGVRHRRRGHHPGAGARDREPQAAGEGRRRPPQAEEDHPQEGPRGARQLDRQDVRAPAGRPARAADQQLRGLARDGAARAGPRRATPSPR